MSPLTLRTSRRRPMLALMVLGGVMTMSPVHAALSSAAEAVQNASATSASTLTTADGDGGLVESVLGDDLLGGDLLSGDLLGGDLLGDGLATGDLLGGDLLDGDLLGGGLPTGDLLGGDLLGGDLLGADLLGGDLLGGNDTDDPSSSSAGSGDSSDPPENGISIAGLHMGMKGHLNSLEELLDPCDSLTGRIHTGIQGADLLLRPALPARDACPDPAPPVNNPGTPHPGPRTIPGTEVLPAALEQPNSRLVMAPSPTSAPAPGPGAVLGQPGFVVAADPGTPRGALPRTGPDALLQGPLALALLGVSGALRAALGRRRPVLS